MTDTCYYAEMTTPIGDIMIVATQAALVGCYFVNQRHFFRQPSWQKKSDHPILTQAKKQLSAYFSKQLQSFTLPLSLTGTPFQKTVWQALANAAYGKTLRYQDIANAIGKPAATRAVGTAIGKNQIGRASCRERV